MTISRDEILCLIKRLQYFNNWRRGIIEDKQPSPKQIGEDIDTVISVLEDHLNQPDYRAKIYDQRKQISSLLKKNHLLEEVVHEYSKELRALRDYKAMCEEMAIALTAMDAMLPYQTELQSMAHATAEQALSKYEAMKGD